MKLVFYSGGCREDNRKLDQALFNLSSKKKLTITYIPACSYTGEEEYQSFVDQYDHDNTHTIIKFDIDREFSPVLFSKVLKSDVIHLGGGNTFYFLAELKRRGILKELKDWSISGGILTGLSAGAIIMTQNIQMAAIPTFDRDVNEFDMKNLKGMNLVKFEFCPHYKNSARYDKELLNYSKTNDVPVYACPDGSGIIVLDKEVRFIGKTYCFSQGKKLTLCA